MEGKCKRRNKGAFSNIPGVIWTEFFKNVSTLILEPYKIESNIVVLFYQERVTQIKRIN